MNHGKFREILVAIHSKPPAVARGSFLTTGDLFARWENQVSRQNLAFWRLRGTGPEFVKSLGRVLYPIESVENWERQQLGIETTANT